jgi:hypothetical protein
MVAEINLKYFMEPVAEFDTTTAQAETTKKMDAIMMDSFPTDPADDDGICIACQ